MAIKTISNFDIAKQAPLDARMSVADETARLALSWYFKGLKTRQADTSKLYEYIGDETTNVSADWRQIVQIHRGTAAPAASLGFVDDIFIDETNRVYYLKTAVSTWTSQFSFSGSQILISLTDPPDVGDGENGDISIYSNGKVWKKEAGVWNYKFSVAGTAGTNGDRYATTSVTSINLGTAVAPLALTVGTGLAYTVGQEVEVVSSATPTDNLTGTIDSYDSGTGAMVLSSLTINGTGTHTDWVVNLSGAPGKQGIALVHTEHDITLTQAKIDAVVAGTYTPQNPWNASVLNDTRSATELTATTGIQGSMVDHSISYNGSAWSDNGLWRGRKGDKGDTGSTGATGATGAAGSNAIQRNYLAGPSATYITPSESAIGNYDVTIEYTHNTTNEPRIELPSLAVSGIHYKILIVIYNGHPSNSGIAYIRKGTGSGIIGSDGLLATEYKVTIPALTRKALVLQSTIDNGWTLDDVNTNKLQSSSVYTKASSNLTTYVSTTTRNYPNVGTAPSLVMTDKKYVRPRVVFQIQAAKNEASDEQITCVIQRATNSSFTGATTIKTLTVTLNTWRSIILDVIDTDAPKSTLYYRLVATCATAAYMSSDYDVNIHSVPYDIE